MEMNTLGSVTVVTLLTAGFLIGFVNCLRWIAWLSLRAGRALYKGADQFDKLQCGVEEWLGKKWREERA